MTEVFDESALILHEGAWLPLETYRELTGYWTACHTVFKMRDLMAHLLKVMDDVSFCRMACVCKLFRDVSKLHYVVNTRWIYKRSNLWSISLHNEKFYFDYCKCQWRRANPSHLTAVSCQMFERGTATQLHIRKDDGGVEVRRFNPSTAWFIGTRHPNNPEFWSFRFSGAGAGADTDKQHVIKHEGCEVRRFLIDGKYHEVGDLTVTP